MASLKKSLEGLNSMWQTTTKLTGDSTACVCCICMCTCVFLASTVAEEMSRQVQSAIGTAANKATDAIKVFEQKLGSK
uniref:Uncharacterized protein n=1 Tax=Electrophorus electricus TaxID=8005 RepID=A0A4W4G9R9_ELEEL